MRREPEEGKGHERRRGVVAVVVAVRKHTRAPDTHTHTKRGYLFVHTHALQTERFFRFPLPLLPPEEERENEAGEKRERRKSQNR
jgi:hypothetical protein